MQTRLLGVLSVLILLVAGCANRPGDDPGAAPPAPAWTEPAAYKFSFESSCGEQALIGRFRVTVVDRAVASTEGLDEAGRRALMLRIANLVPTLGGMEQQAEQARADGAEVTVERDPDDGHPVAIRIDPTSGTDDETCWTITDYTIGGKAQPFPSPTR